MTHATDCSRSRQLQRSVIGLVRAFGLHQSDRTPCGQPLTVSQAHALMELEAEGPMLQAELVQRLDLHPSVTSRLVHGLLERGWVEQVADADDRRRRQLSLSEAGSRIARSVDAARTDLYARVSAALSEDELETTMQALSVLATAMREVRDGMETT